MRAGPHPSWSGRILRPLLLGAVALGAVMLPRAAAALAAGSPATLETPNIAADTFHATVSGASGRFSGEVGGATVVLHRGPGLRTATTSVTISFHAVSCRPARRCLHLEGQLTGKMTPQRSLTDVGHRYALTLAGTVAPLGRVSASGTATGTGFIRDGHTKLAVTLRASAGIVSLSGQSRAVPAFTNP